MGSINFNEFKNINTPSSKGDYTYIDLWLDIIRNQQAVSKNSNINKIDIRMAYDEEAIKNSIVNIFRTIPGERFLIPTFGANLLGYVFKSVTENTANEIGRTILDAIRIWEPRVIVKNVTVIGKEDEHEYNITISLEIPSLKKKDVKLVGVLSDEGFVENRIG